MASFESGEPKRLRGIPREEGRRDTHEPIPSHPRIPRENAPAEPLPLSFATSRPTPPDALSDLPPTGSERWERIWYKGEQTPRIPTTMVNAPTTSQTPTTRTQWLSRMPKVVGGALAFFAAAPEHTNHSVHTATPAAHASSSERVEPVVSGRIKNMVSALETVATHGEHQTAIAALEELLAAMPKEARDRVFAQNRILPAIVVDAETFGDWGAVADLLAHRLNLWNTEGSALWEASYRFEADAGGIALVRGGERIRLTDGTGRLIGRGYDRERIP